MTNRPKTPSFYRNSNPRPLKTKAVTLANTHHGEAPDNSDRLHGHSPGRRSNKKREKIDTLW